MKDIKLTIEEIKKGCEFADGFGYDDLGLNTELSCFGWGIIEDHPEASKDGIDAYNSIYYPLFLQRVIEGINEKFRDNIGKNFYIEQSPSVITARELLTFEEDFELNYNNYDGDIDQAKTQAIKHILSKI